MPGPPDAALVPSGRLTPDARPCGPKRTARLCGIRWFAEDAV